LLTFYHARKKKQFLSQHFWKAKAQMIQTQKIESDNSLIKQDIKMIVDNKQYDANQGFSNRTTVGCSIELVTEDFQGRQCPTWCLA
jgi:hypothetical protein